MAVGINLQAGQDLIISAPIEAAELVRAVATTAYRRGAGWVTCLYEDPELLRIQILTARDVSRPRPLTYVGIAGALEAGAARLFIHGPRPDLLVGVDIERAMSLHTALARARAPEAALLQRDATNWSAMPIATAPWAELVFPELTSSAAKSALWDAIFAATRSDAADPVEAWRILLEDQQRRCRWLQDKAFQALRLTGPGQDLTIGLTPSHRWRGAARRAANGAHCVTSMPSEAILTELDPTTTTGHVTLSRPITIAGTIVEDLRVSFEAGAVTQVSARSGAAAFCRVLSADRSALQLERVGLVGQSSPLAAANRRFYNPMLDGSAATFVTFGKPTQNTGGPSSSDDNEGLRIDAIVGSAALQVDGIDHLQTAHPVMRAGAFIF